MVRYILGLILGFFYFLKCTGKEFSYRQLLNGTPSNLMDNIPLAQDNGIIFFVYKGHFTEATEPQNSEIDGQHLELEINKTSFDLNHALKRKSNLEMEWVTHDSVENQDEVNLYVIFPNPHFTHPDFIACTSEMHNEQTLVFNSDVEQLLSEAPPEYERQPDLANLISLADAYIATAGINGYDLISSYPYEIGSIDLDNGGIGFINGINNNEGVAKEHAIRISQYAKGAKIYGVYNATHSALIDILECILGHCQLYSPPVQMLRNQWDQFVANHGPEAKFLQICHSSGTIYVFNALASSPKEVRERIIVLAISPGAVIPKKLCFEAYNYASKRDIVPHLDAIGKIRYGDHLILLEPHPDAPHFDHGFDSPTFQTLILYHINNYLRQIGYIK